MSTAMGSRSPLQLAAESGDIESVRRLIAAGSNVNEAWKEGESPLCLAAAENHIEIAKLLLESGAENRCFGAEGDWREMGPLHHAAWRGHLEMCRLLLDNGAEVDERRSDDWTPLLEAAYFSCAKYDKNDVAMTPEEQANAQKRYVEVIRVLLGAGANPNAVMHEYATASGQTPLIVAASQGSLEAAKMMVEAGACVNYRDWSGRTAFDASPRGSLVREFLEPITDKASIFCSYDTRADLLSIHLCSGKHTKWDRDSSGLIEYARDSDGRILWMLLYGASKYVADPGSIQFEIMGER